MLKFTLGTILVFLMIMTVNCTYKNAEDVYPSVTSSCDTNNISYKDYIVPLLTSNCYTCHTYANSLLGGGYVLDTWLNVKSQADNGSLVGNISDPNLGSISHMPRGLPSLSDCDISKVRAWVNQGSKNN